MAQIDLSTISPVNIFNQRWPSECPKSLLLSLDFAAANIYDLNTYLLQAKEFLEGVQSCDYDNSANPVDVTFTCPDTGFSTFFRARWQGFRPLIVASNQLTGQFSAGAGGTMKINLMNTPVQPIEWSTI